MKIEVDDELFSGLAEQLKTTPENVVKIFLEHAKDLPHTLTVAAIQENSSLDSALEKLMRNAEPAWCMGELIEEILGDDEYFINDSGYDIKEGTFWFIIEFSEGDKGELDSVHLQFGKTPLVFASASISDLVLDRNVDKFEDEVNEIVTSFVDEDLFTFEYDWLEHNYLTFSIKLETDKILDLPKISQLHKMVGKIKEMLIQNDSRKNLK